MSDAQTRIRALLVEHGVPAEIVEPGVQMPTVPLAAAAIGVPERAIVKSVLFDDHAGRVVLAIANGSSRISRTSLAAAAGLAKVWLASPDLVLRQTGFPAGGVAPIAHVLPTPVVIDPTVMTEAWVFGGAGSEHALLKIRPDDIVRLTGATIAAIVEAASG